MEAVVCTPGGHARVPRPGPSGDTADPYGPSKAPRPLPALAHVTRTEGVGRGGQTVVNTPAINISLA